MHTYTLQQGALIVINKTNYTIILMIGPNQGKSKFFLPLRNISCEYKWFLDVTLIDSSF